MTGGMGVRKSHWEPGKVGIICDTIFEGDGERERRRMHEGDEARDVAVGDVEWRGRGG